MLPFDSRGSEAPQKTEYRAQARFLIASRRDANRVCYIVLLLCYTNHPILKTNIKHLLSLWITDCWWVEYRRMVGRVSKNDPFLSP